jgi:hypothetical protein
MLAEFDPYQWDELIFILGCILLIGLYFWNRRRMRDEVRASIDSFPTSITNLTITFWHDENLAPTNDELALAERVFLAAKLAWPEMTTRLDDEKYNVWPVRSPEQRVGWRQYGGIKWKDIPPIAGIPATNPDNGYGGLSSDFENGGTVYIATFISGRSPEALLTHELTHCITRIHNDAEGNHPDEFESLEKRLKTELAKVS